MFGKRTVSVFIGRVREPRGSALGFPGHFRGELFRCLQVRETLNPPNRSVPVPNVEIPALRWAKILRSVFRESIQNRLSAFPQSEVRLAIMFEDFTIRGERAGTEQFVRLCHGKNLSENGRPTGAVLRSHSASRPKGGWSIPDDHGGAPASLRSFVGFDSMFGDARADSVGVALVPFWDSGNPLPQFRPSDCLMQPAIDCLMRYRLDAPDKRMVPSSIGPGG